MRVILNSITGFEDAIMSMYFSKRTWNEDYDREVKEVCRAVLNSDGSFNQNCSEMELHQFNMVWSQALRIAKRHITLGRYIDFSFTVIGLHRGALDDLDAHAMRFSNRIIRSSTRLAKYEDGEKSDFYKGKILTTDEALKLCELDSTVPLTVCIDGVTYVKAVNGYIREDLANNKDALRGLYMLSIPSNCLFRCNMTDFVHVYNERNKDSGANPELKECIEKCMDLITERQPLITRDYFREYNML